MATKPKARASTKHALPVALARRAEARSAAKKTRLGEEAAGLIAVVQRRKRQISEAFYYLGVALKRLRRRRETERPHATIVEEHPILDGAPTISPKDRAANPRISSS